MSSVNTCANNERSVVQNFWRYAIPSLAAMLVSGLYQIVDGIFVGNYIGANGLAGINMSWPAISFVVGVGLALGMGFGALLSISRGEKNKDKSTRIISNAVLSSIVLAALVCVVMLQFSDAVLQLQSATGDSLLYASEYLAVFSQWGFITVAATAIPLWIRNDDQPNLATVLLVLGAILNIALDYLFIVKFDQGLEGAALASIASQAVVALLGIAYFVFTRKGTRFRFNLGLLDIALSCNAIKLGASSLFMFLYFGFILALHNRLFMVYGNEMHVGAFAIVGYIATLYYLFAEGIANGMQPPISFYHGEHASDKIKATFILAIKVVIGVGIACQVVINLFPYAAIELFSNNDPLLADKTLSGLRYHLLGLFLDGFIFVNSVYFMAINRADKAMLLSVGNMLVQLPFLLVLPKLFGINGVWLSVPASNLLFCVLIAPMLVKEYRRLSQPRALSFPIPLAS